MQSYKELSVWQKSIDLVEIIYKVTSNFPKSEIFGLSSQMQRAAVAIPSNIAEGSKRGTLEYIHFLNIANGSAAELETQILIASKLYKNINFKESQLLLEEILKMLNVLVATLKRTKH